MHVKLAFGTLFPSDIQAHIQAWKRFKGALPQMIVLKSLG